MFNKNAKPAKKEAPKPFVSSPKPATSVQTSSPPPTGTINIISPGTRIEGEVFSNGDIRVDGVVDGYLNTKAKVVVGPKGIIKGELICESADVTGKIDGKISIKNELYLKSSAHITGELVTNKLVVESGAFINGNCIVGAQNTTSGVSSKSEVVINKSSGGFASKFKKKETI